MKAGTRAVGVAESFRERPSDRGPDSSRGADDESTLAAAVVRADRVVDGFSFGSCSVGGTDATDAIVALLDRLDREDVQYVLVAGIAPAWYNLLELSTISDRAGRPVVSVSFEASEGLEPALRAAFDGEALEERLARYRRLPARERLTVNDETLFVRSAGVESDEAIDVIRAFTPEGGRPEPLRVARLAARAADRWRTDS